VEKAKSEKVKKLVDVIQANFFTFSLFHLESVYEQQIQSHLSNNFG